MNGGTVQTLFVIDGTSGVWKSDLLNFLQDYRADCQVVRKLSTRKRRRHERGADLRTDLDFVSPEEFGRQQPEYQYRYAGCAYGFLRADLRAALERFRNAFLIVRNIEVLNRIQEEFSQIDIVSVFVYTDFTEVGRRMPGGPKPELREAIKEAFRDYQRHPERYDEVLVNGAEANDFYRLVEMLLERYGDGKRKREEGPEGQELQRDFEALLEMAKTTMACCSRLAKRHARAVVGAVASVSLVMLLASLGVIRAYGWETVEPWVAVGVPILGYAVLMLLAGAMDGRLVIQPGAVYEAEKKGFLRRLYARCGVTGRVRRLVAEGDSEPTVGKD